MCAWGRRGRQYPLPAFLPRYQPQGLSLRPSPHTPAPSLGPSSPRLNISRLGLLVLFLKVRPRPPHPPIHPLLPGPHILVKVPQRQLGQTTGASHHPSSAAASVRSSSSQTPVPLATCPTQAISLVGTCSRVNIGQVKIHQILFSFI